MACKVMLLSLKVEDIWLACKVILWVWRVAKAFVDMRVLGVTAFWLGRG